MTKTTQDLHSVRESNDRLFALKLNMESRFRAGSQELDAFGGVTRKGHAPSAAPLRG